MKNELIIDSLIEKGWFYSENFIDSHLCQNLFLEAKDLVYQKAQIGRGANQSGNNLIRSDSTHWLNESGQTIPQTNYLSLMKVLQIEINQSLYLGLREFECHFAKYQPTNFYKKHLDQHKGRDVRKITAITYLNNVDSGGELVLYKDQMSDDIIQTISPKQATFVCFLSSEIYHEVKPTTQDRYSITGWFRTLNS
jgi:SM-20-related protein